MKNSLESSIWSHQFKPLYCFLPLILCSLFALAFSLFAQYYLNFSPCRLCYLQRIPYFALIPIAFAGLYSPLTKISLGSSLIVLICGALLASYHFSIQSGWIADPCASPTNISSSDAYLSLLSAPTPCSQKTWTIFHLPPSFWNALFQVGMIFSVILYYRSKTNQTST